MKKIFPIFFALLFLPLIVSAYKSPGKPQGFVSDYANIISASDKEYINTKLFELQSSTTVQIAVVTIPNFGNDTIEGYANSLMKDWGIGQKDKNNGLLVLVSLEDREARIEVGYGLEGTITDLQAGNIVNKVMIPAFREGNYSKGIRDAVDTIVGIINKSGDESIYSDNIGRSKNSSNFNFIFFLVFVFISVLVRVLSKTKSWWLGGVIGAFIGIVFGIIWGFVFAGIGAIVIFSILGFILDYVVSKRGPGSGNHLGGMWFGPGGFGGNSGGGGGFGGFGGGFSGGGGASGKW
jgi:uncharacterized protein